MTIITYSSKETQKIAGLLAKTLQQAQGKKFKDKTALVIALKGDLGAGKTTFVQGFLNALGIKKGITSPTFVLMKNYKIKKKNYKNVYHIDCYRIKNPKEFLGIGFKNIISNPENIVLIEWPERIKKILPKNMIKIGLSHCKKENERTVKIS